MPTFEQMVLDFGFKDIQEFHQMVSKVDISTPDKLDTFKDWQFNDGTKKGLEKLFINHKKEE